MDKHSKIYIAGHRGMVGSALVRCLQQRGYENLVWRTSKELDLTRQEAVERFFQTESPEYVFIAAARVGGILANNTYRAEFIYTNLQIESNLIHSAWKNRIKKMLFFSSSCVYPRNCLQPMKEEYLGTGQLEPTNEPYATAKLAGMSMCRAYNKQYGSDFISIIPTNLYGPNDNYDPQQSHVMAALILKFHMARVQGLPKVTLWGTGTPRRELMYVDDAAEAALFLMENYSGNAPVNIGLGEDLEIRELAQLVRHVVGYSGETVFDASKPDGAPRKLLDVTTLHSIGWKAITGLEDGVTRSYRWFLDNRAAGRS